MSDDPGQPADIEWAVVIPGPPPVPGRPAGDELPSGPAPHRAPVTRAVAALVLLAIATTAGATAVVTRAARARAERLATPNAMTRGTLAGAAGRSYAYTWVNSDGSPVRWDPCRPVDWVSSSRGAPAGAVADFQRALERISAATGLRFDYLGEVDEQPSSERAAAQPSYGDGWAPMLVAWAPLVGTPLGTGLGTVSETVGVATPVAVSKPGERGVIVTAQIVFETARSLPAGFATSGARGAVMLHELAHALGLAHVSDPSQLMYDGDHTDAGAGELRAGDAAGLAGVGANGGCLDEPSPDDVG